MLCAEEGGKGDSTIGWWARHQPDMWRAQSIVCFGCRKRWQCVTVPQSQLWTKCVHSVHAEWSPWCNYAPHCHVCCWKYSSYAGSYFSHSLSRDNGAWLRQLSQILRWKNLYHKVLTHKYSRSWGKELNRRNQQNNFFLIFCDNKWSKVWWICWWTCKVLHTKWVPTSLARLYAMRLSSIHSDHILKICKLLKIWQPYCYEYSEMIVCTHVCRSSCFPAVWILLNYVSYVAAGVMLRLWLCSEQCSGSRWDCEGGSLPLWILDMPQTNVLDMAHRLFIGFDSSWLCQVVVFVQPWSV